MLGMLNRALSTTPHAAGHHPDSSLLLWVAADTPGVCAADSPYSLLSATPQHVAQEPALYSLRRTGSVVA